MKSNPPLKTALALVAAFAASIAGALAQSPLDEYIAEGLRSNLVVQQKHISLEQAQQSLKIAQSYFMPSVNLLADYTSGDGGRSISIPVGDLLNPVYASLNQMTQSDVFPQIENVKQNFFPKNFYDARVRTSLPVLNTDLYMNRSIQRQQVVMKQFELDAYKRQLVLDIKTAYYRYQAALTAVRIYESAVVLVNKNVEVNESLLRNGKALPAHYLRSESEAERVKAEHNNAVNQVANARRYFNFLLNRDLNHDVDASFISNDATVGDSVVVMGTREELSMMKTAHEISRTALQMNKLSRVPKVNAFLDLGSQAYNFKYNNDSRYYLMGVQFSLPLFQGLRTHQQIRQNTLEVQRVQSQLDALAKQLQMSTELAANELATARQNYDASREQLRSAQSYFNLVEKGYQQGVNSLIEFLDARNQLTSSQLQQNLRLFEMLTASAKVERETASYTFNNQ